MADGQSQGVVAIKEGHISVRGHFMWRDRYVVVEHGRVLILRSNKSSIKAKIDLLDASTRVVFHEDHTQLTIFTHSHTTVFNCGSTGERDAWVGALFTAKGEHSGDTDCETSDIVLSSMEENEKEKQAKDHVIREASEREPSVDEDTENEYNETLLALHALRSSMMQCHMSLIGSHVESEDEDELPFRQSQLARSSVPRLSTDEDAVKKRTINSLVGFIRTLQHGGRAVLLHLDVIQSVAGISLEEILSAIGDKQRDKQQASSAAIGLQKLHIATFVRYILFHPLYAKHPEITQNSERIDSLVDRYFPHCRLRRFSHDIEQGSSVHAFELDASWQRKDDHQESPKSVPHIARVTPLSLTKPELIALKKKRHSFPNILSPLQLGPLVAQSCTSKVEASVSITLNAKRSSSDHLSSQGSEYVGASKNDSDLFYDDILPDPLRNLLWKYSCQQVAEQLSILHQQQLAKITLWEFVHVPKQSAKAITDHFNRLVAYFVWSVLVEDTPKDRAETIESIITIATIASAAPLNNFHLVMACVGCLGDTPLMPSRLPLTWKRVRPKFKVQLGALRTLCDHSGGFDTLRKRQASESSKGSCIPFIGVIGVTLERLRLVPYLSASPKLGLLDLDKIDRQFVAVASIESAMMRPYKTHPIKDLQQWASTKLTTIDAFVSPRLLQLRSQQLLATETLLQSGSRHSSLYRSKNTLGVPGSSDGSAEGGPPLLPFHEICSLLVSTQEVSERIGVAVEALLADDRQPLASRLRKFHQEFKQCGCHSAVQVVLAGVRNCADLLKREFIAQKSFEVMQLSGLDENSIQLERGVYACIHLAVTRPIATWLFTKVRHAFVDEDKRVYDLLISSLADRNPDSRRTRCCSFDKTGLSPIELLSSLYEEFRDISHDADASVRVHQCREILWTWTKTPYSVLVLLQQTLDVLFLSRELRDTLDLLEAAISSLGKRSSVRASFAGASSKSLSGEGDVQPPERIP